MHCSLIPYKFAFFDSSDMLLMFQLTMIIPIFLDIIHTKPIDPPSAFDRSSARSAGDLSHDCRTVIKLWNAMKGRPLTLDEIENCCKMEGLDCDEQQNVIAIRWIGMDLDGSIPQEIGTLMNLEILYIFKIDL